MAIRFFSASLLASGITLALFWVMTALIASEEPELPSQRRTVVHIVDVQKATPPIKKVRFTPERQTPPQAPLLPQFKTTPGQGTLPLTKTTTKLEPIIGNGPAGRGLGQAETDATPLVRIAPRYPNRALARGQEGRVLIEFTIGRSGAVKDARVVAAEPPKLFDKAALEAVRQWRYSPKIEHGEPIEQPGLRIVIPFIREAKKSAS